jgi:hypothetical protein
MSVVSEELDNYDVVNGLSGMQRDIVLRLCNLIWNQPGKTQMVYHFHRPILSLFLDNWND